MTEGLLQRAAQLVELKRWKEAEQQLHLVLFSEPNSQDALCLLAICQSGLDKNKEALATIKQCIGQQPDNDYYLYLHGLFSLHENNWRDALQYANSAIAFNPNQADYFGLTSSIYLQQRDWKKALENANQGLSLDPDNLVCLNNRSTALLKQGDKSESFNTIHEALAQDPENDHTHANYGWGQLERGDHKAALESFREALKINPDNDLAKAGLVEGLKARYLFYRIWLKYAFWMSNLKAKGQWFFIIGIYVGVRVLRYVADNNSDLAVFLKPIIYAYMVFAISSWLIDPISNLFLRLNVYGRYALTRNEVIASNFVGVSLACGLLSIGVWLVTGHEMYLLLMMYFGFMMLPLGSMLNPITTSKKRMLVGYTIVLALVGLFGILTDEFTLWMIFLFGIVAYGWVANALIVR